MLFFMHLIIKAAVAAEDAPLGSDYEIALYSMVKKSTRLK